MRSCEIHTNTDGVREANLTGLAGRIEGRELFPTQTGALCAMVAGGTDRGPGKSTCLPGRCSACIQAHEVRSPSAFLASAHLRPPKESVAVPFGHKAVRDSASGPRCRIGRVAVWLRAIHRARPPARPIFLRNLTAQRWWRCVSAMSKTGHRL